ncbi:MAG: tetratricopeptide repeat protein [Myxococcales bacterium]|nr:tetratricopeptide repeat protein [Myxococcales bacterium]
MTQLVRLHALAGLLLITIGSLACDRLGGPAERAPELPSYALPEDFSEDALTALLDRARAAIEAQNPGEAADLLRAVASQRSIDPRVRLLYGQAQLKAGNGSLAVWSLQRAAAGHPADSEEVFLYMQSLVSGGDAPTALRILDDLLAEVTENVALLRLRSRARRGTLDKEGSLADLETLIRLEPDDLTLHEGRITLLVELDRMDEARAAVSKLNERVVQLGLPESEQARYCASEALFELQNEEVERSRALFAKCLEAHPDQANVVLPWCHFLEETGELDRAIAVLEDRVARAGGLAPGWTTALARRLVDAGRREEAETLLLETAERASNPGLAFQLADYLIDWGDLPGARDAAYRGIALGWDKAPDEPGFDWSALPAEGRFGLGDLLIRTGDEETIEALIESFSNAPDGSDVEEVYPILLRARLQLERGESREALELFEESFRYWPSNLGARYLAGRAAMELGEFDQGLSLYRDAFRAEPTGSDAGLVLARMQAAEGYLLSAAETLSTRLGQSNDDPDSLLFFAQLASQLGAFESAAATREDLARQPGWAGVAHREAALEVARREGIEAAIEQLESEVDLDDPMHFEALSQWATFQIQEQKPAIVEARLDALERESGGDARFHLVRARALALSGRTDGAIQRYQAAVAKDPSQVEGWVELGELALAQGEVELAHAAFGEARSIEPTNERVAVGLADVALAAGELDEAKRLYRKSLVAHPWQGRAALALAVADLEADAITDQTVVWSRWAARFGGPIRGEGAEILGRVRLARGESREAITAFQVAARDSSTPARALLWLAKACIEAGDEAQARSALERALESGSFATAEEAAEARALSSSLDRGVGP